MLGRYCLYSSIKIASRKTTLARIQAYLVGNAIYRYKKERPIEYVFMDATGDKDLESPLWKMPGKGVFTREFRELLLDDRVDMVVHSWKDLELEEDPNTQVFSVLGRADQRDMLFFKYASLKNPKNRIQIFTSSPRRIYNLSSALKEIFPISIKNLPLEFHPVRGSIRRRLEKWLSSEMDGIVIAKAAIDRLLDESYPESQNEDFVTERKFVREVLKNCIFMILPISLNPNAPAQGGLAVEINRKREDMIETISKISYPIVRDEILLEREELKKHGGGCHQKIGVAVVKRAFGTLISKRGETDSGEVLRVHKLIAEHFPRAKDMSLIWPKIGEGLRFERKILDITKPPQGNLLVTRISAWNKSWRQQDVSGVLWAAGIKTWKELADLDLWVSGCLDGLGEEENIGLKNILENPKFIKLTHDKSEAINSRFERIATYSLNLAQEIPDLSDRKYFFWMSGFQFDLVFEKYPQIIHANHASGPGITKAHIEKKIGKKVDVFLSYEDWLNYHSGRE